MSDDDELQRLRHQVQGLRTEHYHVERILADALNFTYSPVDDTNSPCPGEYVVGDHTPTTMAMTAAWEMMQLRGETVDDTTRQTQLDHWFARDNTATEATTADTDGDGS